MKFDLVQDLGDIAIGDLLLVTDSNDIKTCFQCKEILKFGTGKEEVLLTDDGTNKYFIFSMYLEGTSWVKHCLNLGPGNIHENAKEANNDLDTSLDYE